MGWNIARHAVVAYAALLATGAPVAAQSGDDWRTDFSKHTVPLDEIVSGGPPKDGIPAIDRPQSVSVHEADDWLEEREPVIVISIGTNAKAYPLRILIWHEIVNDIVDDTPFVVTYCNHFWFAWEVFKPETRIVR